MIAYAEADARTAKPHDCGCGCGGQCGCEPRCCDLECLVRPRFFCGQLLTDSDLATMVDWARSRFALTRYRDGWGIVCGLAVTCTSPHGAHDCCPEPGSGPTVYVNPGYAIDCCGNDLVVCDPIPVDLSEVCRPPDDPCDRLPKDPGQQVRPATSNVSDVRQAPRDCWEILRQELVVVDLRLRYHEKLAQGQRPMLRSGCSDIGSCEYSRVLERPCVIPELATVDRDPAEDDATQWEEEFRIELRNVVKEILDAVNRGPQGVLEYLRRHPPYQICFLEDLVCCLLDQDDKGKLDQRIGFWLYLDWLLRRMACSCWSCRPDRGVPLARVLLQRTGDKGAERCRVVYVDGGVPHRRIITKDPCRPLRTGAIDLAPYLWQKREALQQLRGAGVTVKAVRTSDEKLWEEKYSPRLSLEFGEERNLLALLVPDPFGAERVAAFAAPGDRIGVTA